MRTVERPRATRSELLARRSQVAFAQQGRDLLKDKRAALVREFRQQSAAVLGRMAELDRAAAAARRALLESEAQDGPWAVRSAAAVAERDLAVDAKARTVGGLVLVDVESERIGRARADRGFTFAGSTAAVDRTAEAFERQLELVLTVAADELRLRRLAEEIETTTRRVNALDHTVLPRLMAERDSIASTLVERERDELARVVAARRGRQR